MTRHGVVRTVAAGLLALGAFGPSSAQQPPAPVQPTFRTEASFVRVDAYPTRDGVPVEDLTGADFEVLEDNAPQKVETFEHVVVRPAGPQTTRVEPNSQRDANAMAAGPRGRLFVLFLDTYHVAVDASHNIKDPLIRFLDRVIGQDDMVGVMTPEMSAANLTFARKTTTIEGILTREWTWGRRDSIAALDPEELKYEACYPVPNLLGDPRKCLRVWEGVADEMSRRRREKRTLDALVDLTVHMRGLREERTAVIAISNGWRLPRPDRGSLTRMVPEDCGGIVPGLAPIGVTSTGRLSTRDDRDPRRGDLYECDRDRMNLAHLDLDREFKDLMGMANRANVSFYPVDPRGLTVFDTPIGPKPPLPPAADAAQLKGRLDTLRTLAENTDGLAVVDTNALDAGLKRITADLTSYYLLGYYSSNPKLDGSYRRITVRVKRPGVDVRARRGYRAATAEEVSAGRAAAAGETPVDSAIPDALGALSVIRRESRVRVLVARAGDGQSVWVAGELDPSYAREQWRAGGQAVITVLKSGGGEVAQATVQIAGGRRAFMARLDGRALVPGNYNVRVRVSAPDAVPAMESVYLGVDGKPRTIGTPLLFRRGPFTTLPFEPVGDRRFRRNETLRVQASLATIAGATPTPKITLLDRSGRPMNLTVLTKEIDADGVHWVVGDLSLAPLAAGDYLMQIEAGGEKVLTAFTIVN